MADTATGLGIRTLANGDVVAKLVDTAGVNTLAIDLAGKIGVTASDLDIRNLTAALDTITIGSGTNVLAINTDGAAAVTVDGGTISLYDGTNGLTIGTNGDALVSAVDLDIRNLTAALDTVTIGAGTNTLVIDNNGAISVTVVEPASSAVCFYGTSAAVAQNATATFDYVVTDTKTFKGESILAGSRGDIKVEFGTWNGTALTSKGVYFNTPSNNKEVRIPKLELLGDATNAVRVIVTNLGNATDLYCTIQGEEV
jgi:hypothetical protein